MLYGSVLYFWGVGLLMDPGMAIKDKQVEHVQFFGGIFILSENST